MPMFYYFNYVLENYSRAMEVIQENVFNEGRSIFSKSIRYISNKLKSILHSLIEFPKMLLKNRINFLRPKENDIDLAEFEVVNMDNVPKL